MQFCLELLGLRIVELFIYFSAMILVFVVLEHLMFKVVNCARLHRGVGSISVC